MSTSLPNPWYMHRPWSMHESQIICSHYLQMSLNKKEFLKFRIVTWRHLWMSQSIPVFHRKAENDFGQNWHLIIWSSVFLAFDLTTFSFFLSLGFCFVFFIFSNTDVLETEKSKQKKTTFNFWDALKSATEKANTYYRSLTI